VSNSQDDDSTPIIADVEGRARSSRVKGVIYQWNSHDSPPKTQDDIVFLSSTIFMRVTESATLCSPSESPQQKMD
jgi:hypothetical protein